MRILFLTNLYPPHELGGMEQLCQEVVERFRARGHSCHVLTSRFGVLSQPPAEEGITRVLHLQADIHHYRPLDFFLRRPWHERANRHALRQVVGTFQPDLIFIWGMWNLSSRLALCAEQWMAARVAYTVASYWIIEPDADEAYWQHPASLASTQVLLAPARWLALRALAREKRTHRLALEEVACVSQYVRDKLAAAGALPHGARVIYLGIDARPFAQAALDRSPHDEMRLVYTGGILPHKGVRTAIEALSVLGERGHAHDVHLSLIGGGHQDYEARLRQRAGELGLGEQVSFRGRVPREQIPALLSGSDVFLFTSVWEEPLARSVMEAMAAGLAVIGTAVGGQREILEDGANCLVFEPGDAAGLAACIERVSRDPALRARLALAGQKTVMERFTLEKMVDDLEIWLASLAK